MVDTDGSLSTNDDEPKAVVVTSEETLKLRIASAMLAQTLMAAFVQVTFGKSTRQEN